MYLKNFSIIILALILLSLGFISPKLTKDKDNSPILSKKGDSGFSKPSQIPKNTPKNDNIKKFDIEPSIDKSAIDNPANPLLSSIQINKLPCPKCNKMFPVDFQFCPYDQSPLNPVKPSIIPVKNTDSIQKADLPTQKAEQPTQKTEQPIQKTDEQIFTNNIGMKFVYIPKGTFTMGSPLNEPNRSKDEISHNVSLTNGFYMQTTEVTQKQWKTIMGNNPSNFKNCGDDCPVESISWNDIQLFLKNLNQQTQSEQYRLPTEAEWEYVCRLGYPSDLINDDKIGEYAWYDKNSKEPHKVGLKKPNNIGIYDMIGNVWEWCSDWYGKYPGQSSVDPLGPVTGNAKIDRGGSAKSNLKCLRFSFRGYNIPDVRRSDLGFRLVRVPLIKNDSAPKEKKNDSKLSKLENASDNKKLKNSLNMEFIYIPMENGFYIQATEVTQGQWKHIMKDNPSRFVTCGDDCPVELVSWNDIQLFIKNLNELEQTNKYRLPTEKEWEYACMAGSKSRFFFGDNESKLVEYAWYLDNSNYQTHKIAQKKPNPYGIFDILGNVKEWCQVSDRKETDKLPLKGGNCFSLLENLISNSKVFSSPDFKDSGTGFRIVKTL